MGAVLREFRPQCVMHFAASSLVGESMTKPGKYWRNNLVQTLDLLDTMLEHGIRQFIFSSTAATYGNPIQVPIPEDHPTRPINPYGHSKLAVEYALEDYSIAHGLRSISLRYFNAAGAHPDGSIGEHHEPETHLIPLVLQVASGRREFISRFGSTPRHARRLVPARLHPRAGPVRRAPGGAAQAAGRARPPRSTTSATAAAIRSTR